MSDVDFETALIRNPEMSSLLATAKTAATGPAPVLILGEVGTGKTSLARWMHRLGRAGRPFVTLSAAGGRDTSQLREGREADLASAWRKAGTGTLLIEDIDQSNSAFQQDLLNLLERNDSSDRPRVLCTSRRELRPLARQEQFRQDLYYKVTVVTLALPSLDQRKEDLLGLASFLLDVSSILHGKNGLRLSAGAEERLLSWDYPGNIRELENILERAVTLNQSPGHDIAAEDIRFDEPERSLAADLRAGMSLSEVERRLILQTLELTAQNRTRAAQMLGISIRTLRNKLHEYKEAGAV